MSLVPFLPLIGNVIDKLFPDKEKAAEAKYKLYELNKKGELAVLDADVKLALGQLEINKEEAKHVNWFVAGWRPFIGWTCGFGVAYQFLMQPLLSWISPLMGLPIPPTIDTVTLMTMLGGLLGLGGYRTFEKLKGVNQKH